MKILDFNSHAHVERDSKTIYLLFTEMISTHTLTWSVTFDVIVNTPVSGISTHTLTWSVTTQMKKKFQEIVNFNSHAHVERDFNCPRYTHGFMDFNSHAHVERDFINLTA